MISAALVLAATVLAAPFADPWGSFKAEEYCFTGKEYDHRVFHYRVFVPNDFVSTERYPLLVWLHGMAEGGLDNEHQLRYLNMAISDARDQGQSRFFILATQCPSEYVGWTDDMITLNYEVLQKTLRQYPIDPDRVYLSGVSSGGGGCWEMARRTPRLFAAVAPIASGVGNIDGVEELRNVPIWAFHNSTDKGVAEAVNDAAQLAAAGWGNCHLTLTSYQGHEPHNAWESAFNEYHLMSWLLTQRRGGLFWLRHECCPWKWWHVVTVPGAFLTFAWWGWCRRQRRRRR